MSQELEKSMRIISDLVSFCYYEGADEFDMSLRRMEGKSTKMNVTCRIANMEPRLVEKIRRIMGLPRQREVEQTYWELSGETEFGGELALAGAMSDNVEVSYADGVLSITVRRDI